MIVYCDKFKKIVLDAYNNGALVKNIVNVYNICRKTLYNWRKRITFVKYGPKNITNKYSHDVREYILKYTINNDKFIMNRLLTSLYKKFNIKYTRYNVYYILRKLNVTYKKAKKYIIIIKRSTMTLLKIY